jgi:hypothetical protein
MRRQMQNLSCGRRVAVHAIAGRPSGLVGPHLCYEFNSALTIALATPEAEKAWLTGNDIFAAALRQEDTVPFEESPGHQMLFGLAFGDRK